MELSNNTIFRKLFIVFDMAYETKKKLLFWPCDRYPWWDGQARPDPTRPYRSLTGYFSVRYKLEVFTLFGFCLIFLSKLKSKFLINIVFFCRTQNHLIIPKFDCLTWNNVTRANRTNTGLILKIDLIRYKHDFFNEIHQFPPEFFWK